MFSSVTILVSTKLTTVTPSIVSRRRWRREACDIELTPVRDRNRTPPRRGGDLLRDRSRRRASRARDRTTTVPQTEAGTKTSHTLTTICRGIKGAPATCRRCAPVCLLKSSTTTPLATVLVPWVQDDHHE